MPTLTDPAKELADLCQLLSQNIDHKGDEFLAAQFCVDVWSPDFYKIIFCILDRITYVESIIETLEIDEDILSDSRQSLGEMRKAFALHSLANNWKGPAGPHFLRGENSRLIKGLSGQIRDKISYPKLDNDEQEKLLNEVDDLLSWLTDLQTGEQDFIRQALIEGLNSFRFSLNHLNWVGWGYTLKSLREVIGAYMALDRGIMLNQPATNAQEIIDKVGSLIKSVYEKIEAARKLKSNVEFILQSYGAASLFMHTPNISGLLTQS
jgi:gas vesicle protein